MLRAVEWLNALRREPIFKVRFDRIGSASFLFFLLGGLYCLIEYVHCFCICFVVFIHLLISSLLIYFMCVWNCLCKLYMCGLYFVQFSSTQVLSGHISEKLDTNISILEDSI